jgi:2-haloacid dehalogenase
MAGTIDTVIFDLGGVLIDWNPRYVYRTIFDTEEKIDWFFENVCTNEWNENQDAGYPLDKATEELVAEHPQWEREIRVYYDRWVEMLGGPIQGTVQILRELKKRTHLRLFALTNWSHETFPVALERFDFLHWFDGIVVSGEEKTRKPFPDFYHTLLERHNIDPRRSLFIDDNLRNVKGAEAVGINGIHFVDPPQLKAELKKWDIIVA